MSYDPVKDYLEQTGKTLDDLDAEELELLKRLSKHEVDALVSIDNKGSTQHGLRRVGATAY